MELEEIIPVAKPRNVSLGRFIKIELIKALQTDEGNFDCFATAHNGVCDQVNCLWRIDCFAASRPN